MGSGPEAEHDDASSLLAARNAEIAALTAQNSAAIALNEILLTRIAELEGLVAALHAQIGRDSSNSGKPPSSDSPFVKKPAAKRSSRQRSGKKPGKQPGSPGTTLCLVDDPDDMIIHQPSACIRCSTCRRTRPSRS